ncbi:MAG: hypothetical protein ACRD2P_04760 [Terriglobia bacterium]
MSNELELLKLCREKVCETLYLWENARARNDGQFQATFLKDNWAELQGRMGGWWAAYKKWEAADTFYEAFRDKRMTVRTFGADFKNQRDKKFAKIDLDPDRFFADGQYTRTTPLQQALQHRNTSYSGGSERENYWARRGIDSSPFADPANFISRDKKYEEGLHDLSASLLNPRLSIFKQIHNSEQGAHFSLLPLSPEEDQKLLYDLTRLAKELRTALPPLYLLVRGYRAEMTRIKVAQEMDMGTGYIMIRSSRPGGGPQYKLRYGLVGTMTYPGQKNPKAPMPVTANVYAARRQAALKFKSILDKRDAKNEIIISIRCHAGQFPVYAIREGEELVCYKIVNDAMKPTGDVISANGHVTHPHIEERGAAGLPVRAPAAILPYNVPVSANVPVRSAPLPPSAKQGAPPPPGGKRDTQPPIDATFRGKFEGAVQSLGDIPKRSGLRVFVVGPNYDEGFRVALAHVEGLINNLNRNGYRLTIASLPNRPDIGKVEVRLYFI